MAAAMAAVGEPEMLDVLRLPFDWAEMVAAQAADVRLQLSDSKQYAMVGDVICLKRGDERVPVLPDSLLQRTLDWLHQGHGHQGVAKMLLTAAPVFHVPKLAQLLRAVVRRCGACMSDKPYAGHGAAPLKPISVERANTRWQIDYFVVGELNVLNIVDVYSGYSMAQATDAQTAAATIAALESVAEVRGLPREMSSDNGPHFSADATKQWLREHGVKQLLAVPWSPQSSGLVEASNGALKAMMRTGATLAHALRLHNFVPRVGMDVAPATAYMGANPVRYHHLVSDADPDLFDAQRTALQNAYKAAYDERTAREPPAFAVGQIVFVKNPNRLARPRYTGPARVVSVHEDHLEVQAAGQRRVLRVHKRRAKPGHVPMAREDDDDDAAAPDDGDDGDEDAEAEDVYIGDGTLGDFVRHH